ncbi:MAG: trigger factor [Cytophagales bacterium]|nr:trigger factor [Cytophagales bacterium]
MDISLNKKSPTEGLITIKLNEADYQSRVASKVEEYRKKADIKGFRPGKVPTPLIKKMYGKSILIDEINTLLSESLVKYIEKNDIPFLGDPLPALDKVKDIDWESQKEFEFEYAIGIAGDFEVELSEKISILGYEVNHVAEKTVDGFIEMQRRYFGKLIAIEKSEVGDIVEGELAHPISNTKIQIILPINRLIEKEQPRFIGLGLEEKVTCDILKLFKEDKELGYVTGKTREELSKLEGPSTFTVKQIERIEPAEVTQEFFDEVFEKGTVKSEQEFKEKTRERLIQRAQIEADLLLEQAIEEKLVEEININLPDNFLKKWLQKEENTIQGEEFENYYQQYLEYLKWSLIVEKIAKDYSVKVTHKEVLGAAVVDLYHSIADDSILKVEKKFVKVLNNYLYDNNGYHYKDIYEAILSRKVTRLIRDKITIDIQKVSFEEFNEVFLA